MKNELISNYLLLESFTRKKYVFSFFRKNFSQKTLGWEEQKQRTFPYYMSLNQFSLWIEDELNELINCYFQEILLSDVFHYLIPAGFLLPMFS